MHLILACKIDEKNNAIKKYDLLRFCSDKYSRDVTKHISKDLCVRFTYIETFFGFTN